MRTRTGTAGRALVVGGTGMLANVARELGRRGMATTVLARDGGRAPAGTIGVSLDYRRATALARAIRAAGPFDLAVVWMHGSAPDAPLVVARALAAPGRTFRYLHVLGSAAADPRATDAGRRAAFESIPGLAYEEVVLGFVVERGRSRWLTHEEICSGALGAVDAPAERTIVGTVRPWSARP